MSRLVISRSVKQSIAIGEDIVVTIVSNKGGTIRVAIDAPLSVPVHRQEVWEAIQEAATDAVEVDGSTSLTEVEA
jgi:carbon storage regulator